MSSILKALKKLDNNSPQQKEGENHLPQTDPKQTIQKRIRGIRTFQRIFSVLSVSLILIGCMWLILKYNPLWVKKLFPDVALTEQPTEVAKPHSVSVSAPQPVLNEPKKEIVTQKPLIIPEKKAPLPLLRNETHVLKEEGESEPMNFRKPSEVVKKEPTEKIVKSVGNVKIEVEKPSLPEKKDSSPVLSQKKQNIPLISDAEKKSKDSDDLGVQALTDAVSEPERDENDDSEEPVSPEDDVTEAVPGAETEESQIPPVIPEAVSAAPEKKKPAPEPETTAVAEDPRFRLQALVWSPDPQNRFVVINDRITRIGNSVTDGVFLDSIGEDYVIIQEGNKKWKQMFQMK